MHTFVVLAALLSTTLASPSSFHRREQCDSIASVIAQLGSAGSGGRKVGFVLDASGSMSYNDPNDLRLAAAKQLNDALISSAKAGSKKPDQVAVVDFSDEGDTRLLYPLGDPSGADAAIDQVDVRGQTFIGGGIIEATNALVKSGDVKDKSALVVFTDGVDNTDEEVDKTIQAIIDAGKAGIRVHFGFLDVSADSQDLRLITAILNTNGVFSTIATADDINKFVVTVLAKGLAASDNSGGTLLLPQLVTSAQLSQTGPSTFQYMVKNGETINITATAITAGLQIKETLKDSSGKEISSQETTTNGGATIKYTSKAEEALTLEVTAVTAGAQGLFSIEVGSTLACGGISTNVTTNVTTTIPNPNTTTSASPSPIPYTGAASSLHGDAKSLALTWGLGAVVAVAFVFF